MKIARVFLRSAARRPASNDRLKWRQHLLSVDLQDPSAHLLRLQTLLAVVASRGVDVAVLPACTFAYDGEASSLAHWRKRFGASAPLTIVGGIVAQQPIPARDDLWMEEVLCAFTPSSSLLHPQVYGPTPLLVGDQPVIAAISSSIKEVRDHPAVFAATARLSTRQHPLLIADAGHEPYQGGRYVKLLKNVLAAMAQEGAQQAQLVVASWTWRDSTIGDWSYALDDRAVVAFERIEVARPGGADIIDIITV